MSRDAQVRVAVWTGDGERAFNSGADLSGDITLHLPQDVRDSMLARGMGPVDGDFVLGVPAAAACFCC